MDSYSFKAEGSLGDSYIIACKLNMLHGNIKVFHHTKHYYWQPKISEIYSLNSHILVEFTDEPRLDLCEITSDTHEQKMNFFPDWKIKSNINIEKPYWILQPHSGKVNGGNAKFLPFEWLNHQITMNKVKCVILGTSPIYEDLGKDLTKCTNLIGKTSIKQAMSIIRNASLFFGPEGLLSFVALSYKIPSIIFYSDFTALERRVVGTPWENHVIQYIPIQYIPTGAINDSSI